MSSRVLATRRGTVLLGIGVAVLAAIVLLVYLNSYRNSVNANNQALSVLVAKSVIQKGTPGNVIGTTGLYEVTNIPKSQVKADVFVDPKTLTGKYAVADIYPGQQLTAADFSTTATNALTQDLAKDQRAVVVALDSPSMVGGQIGSGDHVDVWVAFNAQGANGVSRPLVHMAFQNMYVMNAGTNGGGNVTLRATTKQAGELVYASQNAKIWLVLRPTVGSSTPKPPTITANDLLGLPPVRVGG